MADIYNELSCVQVTGYIPTHVFLLRKYLHYLPEQILQALLYRIVYVLPWIPIFGTCEASEWVITFNGLFRTAGSEVHVIHINPVIMSNTLESLYSLT